MSILFVAVLTVLEAAAGTTYFLDGDWRRGIYWVCAAFMSVVVTL